MRALTHEELSAIPHVLKARLVWAIGWQLELAAREGPDPSLGDEWLDANLAFVRTLQS